MDRERHTLRGQTERGEKKRRRGEWRLCQERRAVLFLWPLTAPGLIQNSRGTLNSLTVLNYQDLHGNDDYLLRFTEKEGHKSFANKPRGYFNPAALMDSNFCEV